MIDPVLQVQRRRALRAGFVLGLAGVSLVAGAQTAAVVEPAPAAPGAVTDPVVRTIADLGVELVGVRLSGSDFLIDLRYRIKDVGKAQSLVERKVQPVLVNEATGDRFYIPQAPKIGALKQSATSKQPAILDRVYFMLFANPDRKLKAGEKVTLYAGDSVVKDLVVQ